MTNTEHAIIAAFLKVVGALERALKESLAKQPFDIIGAGLSIPVLRIFDAMVDPLAVILDERANRAIASVRRDIQKKPVPVPFDDLVSRLANEWAMTHSSKLVREISETTRSAIQDIIADGIRQNLDIPEIARNLRDTIGLTSRDANVLVRVRADLVSGGMPKRQANATIARRRTMMINARAKLIAQTEQADAVETAKLQEWAIALRAGELPTDVGRHWQTNDPCKLCMALGALPPVPLNQPFVVGARTIWGPPAHPRCKCSATLVFGVGIEKMTFRAA